MEKKAPTPAPALLAAAVAAAVASAAVVAVALQGWSPLTLTALKQLASWERMETTGWKAKDEVVLL